MMRPTSGFTLIEIILALVLVGMLASLAGPNLAGSLLGSAKSLQNLNNAVSLQSLMEQVIEYRKENALLALSSLKTYAATKTDSAYAVSASKTGYCTLSGSTFIVDTAATSGNFYMLTLVSNSTSESLTTLFAAN